MSQEKDETAGAKDDLSINHGIIVCKVVFFQSKQSLIQSHCIQFDWFRNISNKCQFKQKFADSIFHIMPSFNEYFGSIVWSKESLVKKALEKLMRKNCFIEKDKTRQNELSYQWNDVKTNIINVNELGGANISTILANHQLKFFIRQNVQLFWS